MASETYWIYSLQTITFPQADLIVDYSRFSELNSIKSTESIEVVEN